MPQVQSPKRFEQLLQQHPYLQEVVRREKDATPLGAEFLPEIRIKRGDADLLFRRADNVDGDRQNILDMEDHTVVGAREEYYIPLFGNGDTGNVRLWSGSFGRGHFVRDVFHGNPYDNPAWDDYVDPYEVVNSIIWVTAEDWWHADDNGRPSGLLRRRAFITVYQPPREGWRKLYIEADPLVNVTLHGWQMLSGAEFDGPYQRILVDRFKRLAMKFQDEVWATGLGVTVDASRRKGMSGHFGDVEVLTYIMAGRLMVQFERGGASITLNGLDEPNPNLGFGSIHGTAQQAEQMVRDAIAFWQTSDAETRRTVHQDNDNVSMGF
jgi:hypothetical protein